MTRQQAGVSAEAVAKLVAEWRDRADLADGNARNAVSEVDRMSWVHVKHDYNRCIDELYAALATAPPEQDNRVAQEEAQAASAGARRTNGWDERDYRLWSEIQVLPSYGLVAGDAENPMLARKEVVRLLEIAAEKRFNDSHKF